MDESNFPRQLFAGAAAAAGFIVAALVTSGAPALPLDDAYIHLAFARNLAAGLGFCFNPGEHSLGFTSPLWIALLALLDRLGANPVTAARWAGVLGGGAVSAIFFQLMVKSLPRDRLGLAFAAAATAATALSGNLAWLAGSGMETALYLALSLLAILLLAPDATRASSAPPRSALIGGAVLGLAVLARPTGLLLALILVAALALRRKLRQAATAAAAAAIVAGPWFIYSVATTGFLLPPTRAGKLASNLANSGLSIEGPAKFIWRHLVYFWKVDLDVLLLFLTAGAIGLFFVALHAADRRAGEQSTLFHLPSSPAAVLGVWAGLDLLMHAFFFRSTAFTTPMHYLRYSAMLIPAAAALAGLGLGGLAGQLAGRARPALLALFLIPLAIAAARLPAWHDLYRQHSGQIAAEHRAASDWIRQNLPPDARIACLDVGVLRFSSGRYVIDLGGLTDPAILPALAQGRVGSFLLERHATHYLEMIRHDSERIVGVRADDGRLYHLAPLQSFQFPPYQAPLLLHSLGMILYEVRPL